MLWREKQLLVHESLDWPSSSVRAAFPCLGCDSYDCYLQTWAVVAFPEMLEISTYAGDVNL